MTYVIAVSARIRRGRVDELIAAATQNASTSVDTEPGCLQFDVLLDRQDPLGFALYEVYADEAAFEAHQRTAHHQAYFSNAHALLESRARTSFRRAYPLTHPEHHGAKMSVSLVINCLARPDRLDALMSALEEVAAASVRCEPGCLQFHILVDQAEPAKLMLYEVYRDEAALELHQQTPHFKKFLAEGLPLYEKHDLKRFDRLAP